MRILLFVCLLLSCFLFGCGNDYIVHYAASETASMTIRWNKYSQTLLLTAHYSKRPALIYFGSDRCPPCVKMKEQVFSNSKIVDIINKSYLPIEVDGIEEQFEDLVKRFNCEVIPAIIILSSTNIPQEIARVTGLVDVDSLVLILQSSATIDVLMQIEENLDELFLVPEITGEEPEE